MSGQHRSGVSGQHRQTPAPELRRRGRIVRWLLAAVLTGIPVGSWWLAASADSPSKPPARSTGTASPSPSDAATATLAPPEAMTYSIGSVKLTATGPGRLVAGSDPRDLPRPLLISDEQNNRLLIIDPNGRTMWEFPRPGDLTAGQTFKTPDDAYFTPNGKQIIATQGDDNAISVIDVATRKIVYTYGESGVAG
jgi:DNA-binding beta-propeller fold protein YncE